MTNLIRKPRHVFVWALNSTKTDNQEQNMFLFNTYNIANNRTITSAQLHLSNGVHYPEEILNPTQQIVRTLTDLLEYNKASDDYLTSPTINLKSFQELYGILYFDLRHQEEELKSGSTKLELKFQLSGVPDAEYRMYALILNEEEISVDVTSGKAILRNA